MCKKYHRNNQSSLKIYELINQIWADSDEAFIQLTTTGSVRRQFRVQTNTVYCRNIFTKITQVTSVEQGETNPWEFP